MALKIADLNMLQAYAKGVMTRVDCHANHVGAVCLTLLGGIIWLSDLTTIHVLDRHGEAKNVLWAQIAGKWYCFVYNRKLGCIEVRANTMFGPALFSFTDDNSLRNVKQMFEMLLAAGAGAKKAA